VLVHGGFRSEQGAWLRRGVTFRFAPVRGGVAVSFPLRAGDSARFATFLPQSQARFSGHTVSDARSVASLSLRPRSVRFGHGYASCCDEHLVAATQYFVPRRDQTVVYTVLARSGNAAAAQGAVAPRSAHRQHRRGGGHAGAAIGAGAVAVLALLVLGLATVRRRRRRASGVGG
jgi:hypothetical protein